MIHLEKRYVFDAALVGELNTLAAGKSAAILDGHADASLGDLLLRSDAPATAEPAHDTGAVDTSALGGSRHAVYVIDANVDQKDTLIAGLPPGADVIVLEANRDGVVQLAEALASRSGVDELHIFAHGTSGELSLGSSLLDQQSMSTIYRSTLAGIGSHLSADADIMVYGCNFAEGARGAAAADMLAGLTGADVAASTDLTGAARYGADWTLEYHKGAIEGHALAFDGFDATLDVAAISASGLPSTNGLHNVGASATWSNVATVGGVAVDIRATVISADASANITFGTTGDDLRMELENGTARVQWDLFLAGTTTPVSADINFQITDLDGPNIESVSASTGFVVDSNTHLAVTNIGALITAAGTQNQNSEPESMIRFSWSAASSVTVDYTATSGNDIRIFNHDGDLDLAFSSPVVVNTPTVDLDGNTPGSNYLTTFTEGGASVSITDPTVSITNSTNIQSAVVVLTNAQSGDSLALGSLPAGISGAVDTSVPGQITITLSGTATAASYETALHNITFSNSSITPDTTPRTITFDISNIAFSSLTTTTTVNVIPVNDPPVALDNSYSTALNTPVSGDVSTNDSDPNGDPLTYAVATGPSHGAVALNANGTYTYTPISGYSGTDSFTYTVSDGNGGTDTATVTITVNGPPVAGDDTNSTAHNTPVWGAVTANDSDPNGDPLTYALATGPTHGSVTLNANGTYTYTPTSGYSGADSFTYTVSDGNGGTDTATVTITIANAPPVAGDDTASTPYNTALSSTVTANDSDPNGDPLTYALATGPSHGSVTLNANGTYTYTPTSGYTGADSFTYTVSDGNGGTASATVSLTVGAAPNAPPVAGDDTASTPYNTALSSTVTANDSDPNGDPLTYALATGPSHGSVTLNANGTYTYTPTSGYSGADSFTYTVSDGNGGTDTATVTITIANAPPVAGDDTASTPYNTALSSTVTANDSDPNGDPLTYALATGPTHGSVTLNANGTYTYTPTSGYTGADSFTYTVSDGNGGTATATVSLTVTPRPNVVPTVVGETITTNVNVSCTGSVASNDSDADGDTLTYSLTTSPSHGSVTLNANGSYTYTPTSGYSGTDSFTYTVNDGFGGTATATATITVNGAPVAVGSIPVQTGTDQTATSLSTSGYFSDPEGGAMTYSATGLPAGLSINPATGAITGTVDHSASKGGPHGDGSYVVSITVRDSGGLTAQQTFAWNVNNPAPIAVNDTFAATGSAPLSGSVAGNDSDPDGDSMTFSLVSQPRNGSIVFRADGTFTYTARDLFAGVDTFTYQIRDADGGLCTATATIQVAAPVVAPLSVHCITTFGDLSTLRALLMR